MSMPRGKIAPPEELKHTIFICHRSTEHVTIARAIGEALSHIAEAQGLESSVYFDLDQMGNAGSSIPDVLRKNLDASEYILYFAAESSMQSKYIKMELCHWLIGDPNAERLIFAKIGNDRGTMPEHAPRPAPNPPPESSSCARWLEMLFLPEEVKESLKHLRDEPVMLQFPKYTGLSQSQILGERTFHNEIAKLAHRVYGVEVLKARGLLDQRFVTPFAANLEPQHSSQWPRYFALILLLTAVVLGPVFVLNSLGACPVGTPPDTLTDTSTTTLADNTTTLADNTTTALSGESDTDETAGASTATSGNTDRAAHKPKPKPIPGPPPPEPPGGGAGGDEPVIRDPPRPRPRRDLKGELRDVARQMCRRFCWGERLTLRVEIAEGQPLLKSAHSDSLAKCINRAFVNVTLKPGSELDEWTLEFCPPKK